MRNQKSLFAGLAAAGMVASFAMGAAAAGNLQEIKAYLNSGITIKYNNEAQVMTDAQGARVYPITYNGTTYVPIRAVSNMLDVKVDWDQASQTVLLGNPAAGVDMIDEMKAYHSSEFKQVQTADKQDPKDISGNSYSHWIYLGGAPREVYGSISFNLEGKYDTLTFSYYANADVTLEVLGENETVLARIPVKGGQVAQTIKVDLLKTSQLTFRNVEDLAGGVDRQELYIFDTVLK